MSLETEIEDAKRVQAFLTDEAVTRVLIDKEKQYFAEFCASKNPAEREALHAKCSALRELVDGCMGVVNNGKFAQAKLDQQQAAQEREEARRSRRPR